MGFVPIAASAQPHPDDPEVLAIFHRGRAMMEVGRYADAVLSFQQVLSHRESAGALFNLGLGLRALDRCREAVAAFERAVRIDTDPNRRHSAEINLRELRDCAARLRLDVRGQPAEVRIDGQRVDWHSAATVFSVDPGSTPRREARGLPTGASAGPAPPRRGTDRGPRRERPATSAATPSDPTGSG
ncbi:MAG: tetratricopeptide repeat protein [Deltaproteobacteria bacterium]|nr:tetratricopeptide repeat protein [Deltaproteobacteria bacterium]